MINIKNHEGKYIFLDWNHVWNYALLFNDLNWNCCRCAGCTPHVVTGDG